MQDSETGSLTGQTLDNYLLRGLLGIGGMAEVYHAIDLALERPVAIKVLPAALATDAHYVRHFRTEAQQVAALNHPHIVPIYGFGEERGRFYHVMPLLHGSLRDRLLHERRLAPEEAVRLTRQVASALEAAHALGLVHRDVKPENILLDAHGDALLTDFGIARELAALKQQGGARTLARTGLPVGTPEYMAPEQLRGESTDQRADVYGLGAVLYELLVGAPPFPADTPYAIAAQVLTAPLVPPSTYNGAVWPALEQVVLQALARDANERYPDMQHFSVALELALDRTDHRTDAVGTAPTLPTLLPLRLSTSVVGVVAQLRGRPARQMVALALAVLLLAGATGGVLVLLHNGGASTASGGTPVATSTSDTGGLGLGSGTATATATVGTGGATATMQSVPTATAPPGAPTATLAPHPSPTPRPSPTPAPTLIVRPMPLVLTRSAPGSNTCIATQTITNTTGQTVGWQWQKPQIGGFHFQINGGPQMDWPSDWTPGVPAGGTDTLTATSDCQPTTQSYPILLTDTLGDQYTFVLQLQ